MTLRALVVDDSAIVRLTLVRRVRAEGREVVEAGSVRSASAVDAGSLSCALLDLDLGDGLGTEVAERLRQARAEIPIAFFTSEKTGDALERARTFGPVFGKPDEIDAAIAWVIRQS